MANFNKVYLIGNLTRDPELRVTPKGTAICQFGLAVNRQFKDEAGNMRDETTFVDIEAWGRQGETISKYCQKGRPLFVEGRLKFDQWEDKASGQKRSRLKVVLEGFQFLGGRGEGGEGGAGGGGSSFSGGGDSGGYQRSAPPPRSAPAPQSSPVSFSNEPEGVDDDVPF
ncbi:single-stranded DNA-binding protein [Cephaloticoccus primus]|uniref:Single-stranded DNA-binding protein n=1 Tax=Cephaloticoccus primus TaxID=1548207 RepID=A0A139SKB7_9BACT|nr:single-stranded DNA-binding protein [Cephaloticoccus primus]KXU35003.1 single-stranded DNA-binding protein [Cephaloticoccus primus]